MNTIEKAIKHFESLQKRYTKTHNGKMCELVAIALDALFEKVRRDKGCEYCIGNFYSRKPLNICGMLHCVIGEDIRPDPPKGTAFKFCPVCGRELIKKGENI